ncbi:MAG: tryptophan synthase subunit alpha [Desulfobacterales bacterium]|nr:tryptophan synthase subunit alpha [Desulfobacterales bacterium]
MLESYLRDRLKEKQILLMTHIVLGYPNLSASMEIVEAMVAAGVDLMELQIPFSEPIADGPVILKANQQSLAAGTTVAQCMAFASAASKKFDIPFLFMTYTNIAFKYGFERFAGAMANAGLCGAIVPDLPPEEGQDYIEAMEAHQLAPIFVMAPTTTDRRMNYLAGCARGFVYCMARKGVTGKETAFSSDLEGYLARCRQATDLPLALGFGVKSREDIAFLTGKADIAVIGSETIRIVDRQGVGAVGPFIESLR